MRRKSPRRNLPNIPKDETFPRVSSRNLSLNPRQASQEGFHDTEESYASKITFPRVSSRNLSLNPRQASQEGFTTLGKVTRRHSNERENSTDRKLRVENHFAANLTNNPEMKRFRGFQVEIYH
jgi:hypothetical protein